MGRFVRYLLVGLLVASLAAFTWFWNASSGVEPQSLTERETRHSKEKAFELIVQKYTAPADPTRPGPRRPDISIEPDEFLLPLAIALYDEIARRTPVNLNVGAKPGIGSRGVIRLDIDPTWASFYVTQVKNEKDEKTGIHGHLPMSLHVYAWADDAAKAAGADLKPKFVGNIPTQGFKIETDELITITLERERRTRAQELARQIVDQMTLPK